MSDIYVDDNAFGYGYLVVAEALLYAGVGAAGQSAVFIFVLNHSLRAGADAVLFPEEAVLLFLTMPG